MAFSRGYEFEPQTERCAGFDCGYQVENAYDLTLPSVSVSLNNLDPSPSWLWES
jgi:hypothetical protein